MQNEKLEINLAPNMAKAELIIREGAAPKELEPKAPVKTDLSGVIGAVVEYLSKRINDRATVEELTAKLRELDANDPCKYDFALFGLGESQKKR